MAVKHEGTDIVVVKIYTYVVVAKVCVIVAVKHEDTDIVVVKIHMYSSSKGLCYSGSQA